MDSRVMYSSANSFKNHARFMPDILNINTRIMHYKLRSSQNFGKIQIRSPWPNLAWLNLMIILTRFWSGHYGQILHGCITSDLSQPYDNLGKILVRSLWPNFLACKTTNELDKILVQFSCLSLSIC